MFPWEWEGIILEFQVIEECIVCESDAEVLMGVIKNQGSDP